MARRLLQITLLLSALGTALVAQQPAAPLTPPDGSDCRTQPAPPKTHLKVGQAAPDFTLTDTTGKAVKLSDFKGKKNVVLAFYVLAFTGG